MKKKQVLMKSTYTKEKELMRMKKVKSISSNNISYIFLFVKTFLKKKLKIYNKIGDKCDKEKHLVTIRSLSHNEVDLKKSFECTNVFD